MGFWFSAAFFQEFFTQQQLEILQNEITVASAEATGAFLGLWKVITAEKFDHFFLGTSTKTSRKVRESLKCPVIEGLEFRASNWKKHSMNLPKHSKWWSDWEAMWLQCLQLTPKLRFQLPAGQFATENFCGANPGIVGMGKGWDCLYCWSSNFMYSNCWQFHLSTWFDLNTNWTKLPNPKEIGALFPPVRSCLCPCTGNVWGCTGRCFGSMCLPVIFFSWRLGFHIKYTIILHIDWHQKGMKKDANWISKVCIGWFPGWRLLQAPSLCLRPSSVVKVPWQVVSPAASKTWGASNSPQLRWYKWFWESKPDFFLSHF